MTKYKNHSRFIIFAFVVLLGGFTLSDARADLIYYADDGMVVGEGELFSSRTTLYSKSVTNGWFTVPDESAGAGTITNARGGAYIQLLPDNASPGSPNNPPEVFYKMQIDNPGTYRLYLRREGNFTDTSTSGSSDSMFLDIVELKDGSTGVYGSPTNAIADWYEVAGSVDGNFATTPWSSSCEPEVNDAGASGYDAEWLIPTQGVYTLRFTQREDGAALDAWVFQLNTLSAPTGDGPPVSATEPSHVVSLVVGDTYIRRNDDGAPYGTNTTLRVKNDLTESPSGLDRSVFLRFDISALSDLEGMILTNATLKIDLLNEGIGTNHYIYVAVIGEDATAETFDELTFTNGVSDIGSELNEENLDFSKLYGGAAVGSFLITESDQNTTVKFSDPDLLSAIRADTDGVLSLVLYRTDDHPSSDDFASKEHATRYMSCLDIVYRPEKFGSIILIY
ncbi:MAG: hypothetical protein PF904_01105 [Kiritimatiellae bacterium]|nr:hypothetical protein [Kiritimatiellia bacterium]